MTKSSSCLAAWAALVTGLGLSTPAPAQDWKPVGKVGWFSTGKVSQMEKGHFTYLGETGGTFFSDKGDGSLLHGAGIKCAGFYDIDTNNKKMSGNGTCVMTDPSGDLAYLKFQAEGDTVPGTGETEAIQWTGGTGKYRDISGSFTGVAHTQVSWQDGTFSGYTIWNR